MLASQRKLALLHIAVGDAAVDHRLPERRQVGIGFLGRVHRRLGDNLHQRRAGAVVIDERTGGGMVELANVFLEMDTRERDFFVLAHDVARRTGQFDLDGTADADRLVELGNLVIFRRVGIKIIFAIPFADRRDFAAQHEAGFDRPHRARPCSSRAACRAARARRGRSACSARDRSRRRRV